MQRRWPSESDDEQAGPDHETQFGAPGTQTGMPGTQFGSPGMQIGAPETQIGVPAAKGSEIAPASPQPARG